MAHEAETLGLAQSTLEDLQYPAYISRDEMPDPQPAEFFLIDLIASTNVPSYNVQATTKRVQVTAYASSRTRTLQLTEQARTTLRAVGFKFLQQRPALDPDEYGEISEYRRG